MFLVQIKFGSAANYAERRELLKEDAEAYLIGLRKNGQIYGDYVLDWSLGDLTAYTYISHPDALKEKYLSEEGRSDLDNIMWKFGLAPTVKMLSDNVPEIFPSWHSSSSFYLFSHTFHGMSPVCCGDRGEPIPLYLLPLTDESREHLYHWNNEYNHVDHVWLASGALEIPAYQQMADPKSQLSVSGRKFCSEIEALTGKPTYYFLHRYYGRETGENTRPCPSCGEDWHEPNSELSEAFHHFQFRCHPCRLVSNIADSCYAEDAKYAHIGEFNALENKTSLN